VARIYDEVDEEEVQDGCAKDSRSQKDSTTKGDVMEHLQDGAWSLKQAKNESVKDGFKNVETRKDTVNKVNI